MSFSFVLSLVLLVENILFISFNIWYHTCDVNSIYVGDVETEIATLIFQRKKISKYYKYYGTIYQKFSTPIV